jgi:ABC-type polysaccharide/polyol phosphate transport system ATPase subunit
LCNRVLLLNHGNVVADGKPEEVIKEYKAMVAAGAA